jgi:hypothetical protein
MAHKALELLDSPRIRFNGGFHDGASAFLNALRSWGDADRFCARHFDRVYAAGYRAGFDSARAGDYRENSEPAWQAYRPARKAA